MCDSIVLGVDIGGTHITAAEVDFQTTALRPGSWARRQVDSQAPAADVLAAWAQVIKATGAWQSGAPIRLGISLPGPFDYEQGVSLIRHQDKFESLYGLNVKELLAEKLGLLPAHIRLHNDAACFLKGEAFGGAAKAARKAIGLTLGTGLGSARLLAGQATDADLWQTPFQDSIAEDYLSTRALVNNYRQRSGRQVKDVEQLAALYPAEPLVQETFRDFGKDLALFLTSFILAEQPEVVVIGGNIAKAWDLFMPETCRHLSGLAPQVALRPALLGETAAMMGAASYWQQAPAALPAPPENR